MTTLRPFRCDDLFHYNNVNLDPLTETYNLAFYLMYLARYPYTTVPVPHSTCTPQYLYSGLATNRSSAHSCSFLLLSLFSLPLSLPPSLYVLLSHTY